MIPFPYFLMLLYVACGIITLFWYKKVVEQNLSKAMDILKNSDATPMSDLGIAMIWVLWIVIWPLMTFATYKIFYDENFYEKYIEKKRKEQKEEDLRKQKEEDLREEFLKYKRQMIEDERNDRGGAS